MSVLSYSTLLLGFEHFLTNLVSFLLKSGPTAVFSVSSANPSSANQHLWSEPEANFSGGFNEKIPANDLIHEIHFFFVEIELSKKSP